MLFYSVLFYSVLQTGCAFDRGKGFSTLEAASLEVSLETESDSDESSLITDEGYEIVVERAAMRVTRMELQELPQGASSEPVEDEGGDHDHEHPEEDREDEESSSALVTLGFEEAISMTAHEAVAADSYVPSRELARSSPRRVLVMLGHLELAGMVSGGELAEALELDVDLPLEVELLASLEAIEIDRDAPESVRLSTTVIASKTLFDGIDFATLGTAGGVVIDDADTAAASTLSASLAASDTHASLE